MGYHKQLQKGLPMLTQTSASILTQDRPSAHTINRAGIGYADGLTDDQIARVAPSVFADAAHESRSERYAYVSTAKILQGMRAEGFLPVRAQQTVSRDVAKRGHAKHLLRFRRADQLSAQEAREVILINSHDGSSTYELSGGVFRLACANGLIVGDTYEQMRIKHSGNILGQVIEGAYKVVNQFDAVGESIERMRAATVGLPQRVAFATAALQLRYDNADQSGIDPRSLLTVRRSEDVASNVWTTFNTVQEKLIKGGPRGIRVNANGQRQRVSMRAINGIDQSTQLNRALWTLAEEFAKLAA
jgi:hypothetical protein